MTILIYGASGAIGAATARRLAGAGHRLHLAGRDENRLAALARETGASFTAADLAAPDAFEAVTQAAAGEGALDGLVFAVGSINLKPLAKVTVEDARRDFEVNALWALQAVQAALPALRRSEGTPGVVLFSSIAVAQGFAAHASISMAKGAVEGLTRALAAELAPKVRVNCIAPSLVDSRMSAGLTGNEALVKAIAGLHALQRIGAGEDVAPLAALLAGPEGGWISGEVFAVNGGRGHVRTKG